MILVKFLSFFLQLENIHSFQTSIHFSFEVLPVNLIAQKTVKLSSYRPALRDSMGKEQRACKTCSPFTAKLLYRPLSIKLILDWTMVIKENTDACKQLAVLTESSLKLHQRNT